MVQLNFQKIVSQYAVVSVNLSVCFKNIFDLPTYQEYIYPILTILMKQCGTVG
jgi:hypothetical protein